LALVVEKSPTALTQADLRLAAALTHDCAITQQTVGQSYASGALKKEGTAVNVTDTNTQPPSNAQTLTTRAARTGAPPTDAQRVIALLRDRFMVGRRRGTGTARRIWCRPAAR
jgi:hypothetical protein